MWLWRTKDNEVREFTNLTQAKNVLFVDSTSKSMKRRL